MDCQIKHGKTGSKYCCIFSKNECRRKAQGEPVQVWAAEKYSVVEQEGAAPGHCSQGRDPRRLDHEVMEDLGRAQGPAPGLHRPLPELLLQYPAWCGATETDHRHQLYPDQSPKFGTKVKNSKKKKHIFFLETSLVHLGASPDTIGQICWPLKEAILEVETFSLNFDKSESKLQRALETSIFIQNASVIPFWKALDIQISKNKCFWTLEVNRGRQRPLKIKKMVLITFECIVWWPPNFELKPPRQYVGHPWKKISWMGPGGPFLKKSFFESVWSKRFHE